ncbi:pyruvate dehydrogenase E1 component beta subunit [Prauserella shujinwangii]|uniref:Pyruvate dehydrogenase E1 component beta subunit n=1 Tax=Prauserella shujinwangii TaxID=1453103 RepID=A0A2T0M1H6_9PSEU|nr:pyruvate dehydrogenase complex E1 component subunit beta [Prauserella shujinwangii]PRX50454.1 pyruvate dehydrogenase E1 component beta subunit [Prauserella shujinwangii]
MRKLKYWQAINSGLAEELRRDPAVMLLGEDVGRPGGAFGATQGLHAEFGEHRVRDTPISEAALTGTAVGAALAGLRPVVEIMFFDFVTLAMDQLVNQAAKMGYLSMGRFPVPLTVRTMCGAGLGSGPQHAQGLEGWLAAVPGLKVVWSSTPADAKALLKAAIRDPDPVVVIESAALWSVRGEVPDDPEATVSIGRAVIRRSGRDATLVAWGAAVTRCLTAADILAAEGIDAEVLDLRTLSPLDTEEVLASLHRTGRLVVVQDATGPCSVGAEVIRLAATEGFAALRAPAELVSAPFAPVPFPPGLERAYFPQDDDVVAAVRRSVGKEM